jgi:hypothetical protein
MLAARTVVAFALALSGLLGCVHQQTPPAPTAGAPVPPAPEAGAPPSQPAATPAPPSPAVTHGPAPGAATPPAPAAAPRPAPPASPPAHAASGTAAQAPAPKRAPAVAPSAATPGTATATAAAPAASAGPTLDLASLEERLRDTHAIGIFTKLSLKNQVDDLLAQFRAFYGGQGGLSLAGLRRSYELLLMKVVTLLQDDDPGLASAVSSSREPIWAILSDRNRFNSL